MSPQESFNRDYSNIDTSVLETHPIPPESVVGGSPLEMHDKFTSVSTWKPYDEGGQVTVTVTIKAVLNDWVVEPSSLKSYLTSYSTATISQAGMAGKIRSDLARNLEVDKSDVEVDLYNGDSGRWVVSGSVDGTKIIHE